MSGRRLSNCAFRRNDEVPTRAPLGTNGARQRASLGHVLAATTRRRRSWPPRNASKSADVGWGILFGRNAQEAADLNLIAHRVAELSLNPGICAQDGFLTSHVIESMRMPERDLVREFLHRCGLHAAILDSGKITVGDALAIGGTSGKLGERALLVTPSARRRPALICTSDEAATLMVSGTWPASASTSGSSARSLSTPIARISRRNSQKSGAR